MADFQVLGHIAGIHLTENAVFLIVTENKTGYRRKDGTSVEDSMHTWNICFRPYFKKYVTDNFHRGSLVCIKGEVLPYAIENGNVVEGYTILGQTVNMASYPRNVMDEHRMIRESQASYATTRGGNHRTGGGDDGDGKSGIASAMKRMSSPDF